MMHFIEKMTPSLSIVNMSVSTCSSIYSIIPLHSFFQTLFLIGGIPFVSGIYTIFSDKVRLLLYIAIQY